MIDFYPFYQQIAVGPLAKWLESLPLQIAIGKNKNLQNSNLRNWEKSVKNLPLLIPHQLDLMYKISARQEDNLNKFQRIGIEKLLLNLMPWRKGPYSLYDINIDAEWRSDWKWQRILPYLSSLKDRTVLDVGCGNGYYMWRMIGAGAHLVIGIDHTKLFLYQFEAIRKLLGNDRRVHLLPINFEQLPALQVFDTVFSMGVLYHCRSPIDHLLQLKNHLISNGELVLETLVINGNESTILVPNKSYAKMRNVYFIPSIEALKNWLKKCGLLEIYVVNCTNTSVKEQRRTKWMTKESLKDFLDPNDNNKTIEGYPAPLRAILIARKK